MKQFFMRLFYNVFGLFLFSVGIYATLRANIGYAPWDVFHDGLAGKANISFGAASILASIATLIIVTLFGEKIGIGTVLSSFMPGIVIDVFNAFEALPKAKSFIGGLAMMIIGLAAISVGTYFYMKSAFCAGPRDNLMVVMARLTKIPIGACRIIVELSVTLIGWALGGLVGIGTVVSAFTIGVFIQITFRAFKFDATAVKNESLAFLVSALYRRATTAKARHAKDELEDS